MFKISRVLLSIVAGVSVLVDATAQMPSTSGNTLSVTQQVERPLQALAQGGEFVPMQYREGGGSAFRRAVMANVAFNSTEAGQPESKTLSFIASVITSDAGRTAGIYEMSTAGDYTLLGASANNNAKGGGVLVGETYYTVAQTSMMGMTLIRGQDWNSNDWTKRTAYNWSLELKYVATDVAYDETTGNIYGCFYNSGGNAYEFGTADYVAKKRETICPLEYPLNAVAVDRAGQVFGIDILGDLYRIEKETGAMAKVGATGFVPKYVSSGTIDKKTGRMYWVVAPAEGGSFLCEVNLSTGQATRLYDLPGAEQITGLFFPDDKAHHDAPAAVSGLAADFVNGSQSGNVVFTMPSTLYSGASLSGALSYRVYVDGKVVAEAAAQPGAQVSVPVSVAEPATYRIEVVAVNPVGEGPTSKVSLFIGSDTPVVPGKVDVAYADGAFNVSWEPASQSVNGGYLDPAKVTYNLYRMPANVAVVEGGDKTTYSDVVPEPEELTSYWYTLQVLYDGNMCGETSSAHVTLGAIIPPCLHTYDDAAALDGYTIIDGNKDNRKWYVYNKEAAVSFNENTDKDDWLITPAVRLQGGKVYRFSLFARANADFYPETFCVMMGHSPTPEAMTGEVIPQTTVIKEGQTVSQYISVAADGLYYIGVHAVTPKGPSMFYIDNLTISEPISGETPAAVSDLTVTATGIRTVAVAFHAPQVSATGAALESIDKVELYRDDTLIHTFDAPQPGAELGYDDTVDRAGNYTYKVVCYNIFGAGTPAEQSLYVGVAKPYRPGVVKVSEPTPGQVTLTWEPSTADEQGNPIDATYMRYHVVELRGQEQVIVGNMVEGTTFTYTPMPDPANQQFMQFAVFAVTEGGVSMGVVSEVIPVGKAYSTPYVESFAGLAFSSIWGTSVSTGEPEWGIYSDTAIEDVASADHDNGYIGMRGKSGGEVGMLYSGKVSLDGVANPTLSFQTYNITGDQLPSDDNDVVVYVNNGEGWKAVLSGTVAQLCGGQPGWSPVMVDLAEYKGQSVQIGFMCSSKVFLFTLFDAIKVIDMYDNNLAALSLTAPRYAKAGQPIALRAVVENNGRLQSAQADVVLLRNGAPVAQSVAPAIDFGRNAIINFSDVLDGTSSDDNTYSVRVDYPADGYTADNVSNTVDVMMQTLINPTVNNLTVAYAGQGGALSLSWSEPDLSSAPPAEFVDSFEEYDSWANSHVGDWTFIDVDEGKIGSLNYINLPGIPTGSHQSFWVMDDTLQDFADYTGGNWRYMAYSGHKYLAQAFIAEAQQCDDWAISPRLYGGEQCVSLYAKSFMAGMPETFEFLVSYTGTDIDDFELLGECAGVPQTWTQYCFNLPDGAQYFAIRCTSRDRFMFYVDETTYVPQGAPRSLSLIGYNVYRNDVRLTDTPCAATSFVDTTPTLDGASVRYAVTAVYDLGESKAVVASSDLSGIDSVIGSDVAIYTTPGQVHVDNAWGLGVTVATVDGRLLYSTTADADLTVNAERGVYIVRAGSKVAKVVVD